MALSIYSLLMLFLITTRWKWNLGCFGAALRTDSMTWKRISGNTTEASFCFNFQGHTGLQFPGVRRNCNWRKAHCENVLKVCPPNPPKQVSPRGIAVMALNHKLFHLKATVWQSKSLSSQAFSILNGPWAQTGARAVAPWHTFYLLDPQPPSFCLSVHQSVPSVLGYSKPHSRVLLWLACGLTGRSPAEGEHGDFTLHWGPLLTLLWGSLFSLIEFMSPHLQLGDVPAWGGGLNIR